MKQALVAGLNALAIEASELQVEKLLSFIELLKKWNKVYNLTALKTDKEILQLHILDSLTVLPFVKQSNNVLDIGSGAGLPGIPLAIMLPETNFVLLDSNNKKTRFMQQAIIDLKLLNTSTVHSRIEAFKPNCVFDSIITRAFAEIQETVDMLKFISTDNLRLLFMKSRTTDAELVKLDKTYDAQSFTLKLPDSEVERKLILVSRK